jgi:hypothetical protein
MTDTIHGRLTQSDVLALAELLAAVNKEGHVRWLDEDANIREGTLRHVVVSPQNYGFLRNDADVRDGYVRITTASGFEMTMAVPGMVDMVQRHTMAFDK